MFMDRMCSIVFIYKTTFIPVLDIQELVPVVQLVDENTLFVKLPLI